ncbi:MAG: metal ABC transporter substrate-binding protein [Candidatus Promineifilaceae bacterium]|nr:metal ABC transporter substrate-binding protein [Candidatus Promineifilaceae bacterium]
MITTNRRKHRSLLSLLLTLLLLLALSAVGCTGAAEPQAGAQVQEDEHMEDEHGHDEDDHEHEEAGVLALPDLAPAELAAGEQLRVVATTSIIGDVAAQVGGDTIELVTLMQPGQDPHSYQPSPATLAEVGGADVILVNGWDLEEGLLSELANAAEGVPLVPVSAGIEPLAFGESVHEAEVEAADEEHDHVADPHVWLDPLLVQAWVENIAFILGSLDPANAEAYVANARAYLAELEELATTMDAALAVIPEERRQLVTNHDALAYFARRFDFAVLGTVIPGASTLAEPSARALAELVEVMTAADVCTVFSESTVGDSVARAAAAELDHCDEVAVLSLYTGALGPPGSGADSYIGMMTSNTETIVAGLSPQAGE